MAVNIHITIIELNALHTKRQNLRSEERFSRNAEIMRQMLTRSEERFSRNAETDLVCRLLLEKKKNKTLVIASRFGEGTAYATLDGHRSNVVNVSFYKTTDYGKTW